MSSSWAQLQPQLHRLKGIFAQHENLCHFGNLLQRSLQSQLSTACFWAWGWLLQLYHTWAMCNKGTKLTRLSLRVPGCEGGSAGCALSAPRGVARAGQQRWHMGREQCALVYRFKYGGEGRKTDLLVPSCPALTPSSSLNPRSHPSWAGLRCSASLQGC